MPPASHPTWWYQCIPSVAVILKKLPDNPILGRCHTKQWSGILFHSHANIRAVNLVAMLGGIHLGAEANLWMTDNPSQPLGPSWRFVPGKAALPFLFGVCNQKTHVGAISYFNQHLDYMTWHEDSSLTNMTFPHPWFQPRFFDTSPHLMMGLCNLIFNNGLQYAKMTSSCPEEISCWHFISSLEGHPDNVLSPQGLLAPQVAQVLVNFWVCLERIFANRRDYPDVPDMHQSPITWCGTFHGGLLRAIRHLLTADTVAAWTEHCNGLPGQGLCLTTSFLHYIGLLIRLFKDWLVIAEQDAEYCQLFISYDSSNPLGHSHKTGHVLATDQLVTWSFETEFNKWDSNLCCIFSPQSSKSFSYQYEEAFSFDTPSFALPKPAGPKIDFKCPLPLAYPTPEDKCHACRPPQLAFQPPSVQPYQLPGGTAVPATRGTVTATAQSTPASTSAPPEPALTSDQRERGAHLQQSGKSNAMVPMLCWTGISGTTTLPNILKTWHLAAPAGTTHTTPSISGKWLSFKFCNEGLFCQPSPGQTCTFTHVDLAQPNPWNSTSLSPLVAFMAQPGIPALGITLTPAGKRATCRSS